MTRFFIKIKQDIENSIHKREKFERISINELIKKK